MSDAPLGEARGPDRVGFWLYTGALWTVFGLALSNLLFGAAVLASLWQRQWRAVAWRRWRWVLLPLGIYAGCVLTSIVFSRDPQTSARASSGVVSLAILPLGLLALRGERRVRWVVDGIVAVAALCAAHGLIQQSFLGYGGIDHRIRGPFSHYMTFAGFLLMADLLLIGMMVCGRHRNLQRWLALGIINLSLLLSLTRSVWVAFAIALTLCLLLRRPRWVLAYVPAALLLALLAPVPLLHRVVSIVDLADVSNYDRLCMAEAGLLMVEERPFFGLGPRMVRELYPLYRHPTAPRRWVPHLHNNLVHVAAEEGLPAMAALIWLMGGALIVAYRGYRAEARSRSHTPGLYLGGLLALAAFNLAGLFEYNWGDTEVQRVALFLVALPWALAGGEPAAAAARDAD
ncbi:MAG: O-antigen ligase family protein [Thermoanaerobaculia bacterium]